MIDRGFLLRALLPLGAIAAPCLSAASLVGWTLGRHPYLGAPWLGFLYPPSWVLRWYAMGWADGRAPGVVHVRLPAGARHRRPFVVAMLVLGPPGGGRGPFEAEAGSLLASARDLLAAGGFAHRAPGIPVGLDGKRPLFRTELLHTLLLGPTGIGKGVSTIMPLLVTWTHSALVKDPKPELCQSTGRWRGTLGPVFCLKPDDPRSARCNPVLTIRVVGPAGTLGPIITDAQTLAGMLAHAGETGENDGFWNDATALVVTGLLIATRLSPEPTIATFYRMMRGLVVGRQPECEHPFARSILGQVWSTWPERTRGSVFVNLEVRLAFLASPLVQAVLSGDDFTADDLQAGPEPVTVYVCTPLVDAEAMRALHRLLIAALLRPLTYDKRRTLDGRKKLRPLMVVWDEFPADGHIPAFETYAANLRGFDVWLVLAAQDQEQIDRVYGPRNAIAINCRLRLFSASLSEPSLRREQELAGTAVTTRHGRSRAGGLLGPVTKSETETTSPVVTKGELLAIAEDYVLVFAPRMRRPAKVPKLRYYEHPMFRGRFDDGEDAPLHGLHATERPLPVCDWADGRVPGPQPRPRPVAGARRRRGGQRDAARGGPQAADARGEEGGGGEGRAHSSAPAARALSLPTPPPAAPGRARRRARRRPPPAPPSPSTAAPRSPPPSARTSRPAGPRRSSGRRRRRAGRRACAAPSRSCRAPSRSSSPPGPRRRPPRCAASRARGAPCASSGSSWP